jgi:Putative endonuclease, protein of unknown function (DUF1780)
MAVTVAKNRPRGREDRPPTRFWLAHHLKPAHDRAVVRTLLHALGVMCAATEIVAPVAAPIDVQFREAHFHLRDLRAHSHGQGGQAPDTRGHQARALADGGDSRGPAMGRECAGIVALVAATLDEHAAWYGARCIGLDALVSVEGCCHGLAPPAAAREVAALTRQGWRSVSVVWPPYGMVLYAASGAPAFLRLAAGRLLGEVLSSCWVPT